MYNFADIANAVKTGKAKDVKELVQQAIDSCIDVELILNEGLIAGMNEIGARFKNNEVYVPEVLVAARAMKTGTTMLKALLAASNHQTIGTIAVGTVSGDLHDIGKNLVCMMMEGAGFEVIDLGVDVSPEKFAEAAANPKVSIVAMSALLTTTMPAMKDSIDAIEAAGLRNKVKIMVGGAPITAEFAKEIGADGYTSDAASAAEFAKGLI